MYIDGGCEQSELWEVVRKEKVKLPISDAEFKLGSLVFKI